MPVIVTDDGFVQDNAELPWISTDELQVSETGGLCLNLDVTDDPEGTAGFFDQIFCIRIPFDSFADGRGFSIAARLRSLGFRGRLRAVGHVLSDQYKHARRCGFDEVEISDDLAARQPESHWRLSSTWDIGSYQSRLRSQAAADIQPLCSQAA